MVPPRDILFSLPTICGRVPSPDPILESAALFDMREDDWRQIEFVDTALTPVIEEQRRQIRDVIDNHSRRDSDGRPFAFDRLHIRSEPADPLPRGITVRRLVELMDADTAYTGVGFHGRPQSAQAAPAGPARPHGRTATLVPGSFAFRAGSLVCYGLVEGGLVKVLGLNRMPDAGSGFGIGSAFEGTTLVNWLATED